MILVSSDKYFNRAFVNRVLIDLQRRTHYNTLRCPDCGKEHMYFSTYIPKIENKQDKIEDMPYTIIIMQLTYKNNLDVWELRKKIQSVLDQYSEVISNYSIEEKKQTR